MSACYKMFEDKLKQLESLKPSSSSSSKPMAAASHSYVRQPTVVVNFSSHNFISFECASITHRLASDILTVSSYIIFQFLHTICSSWRIFLASITCFHYFQRVHSLATSTSTLTTRLIPYHWTIWTSPRSTSFSISTSRLTSKTTPFTLLSPPQLHSSPKLSPLFSTSQFNHRWYVNLAFSSAALSSFPFFPSHWFHWREGLFARYLQLPVGSLPSPSPTSFLATIERFTVSWILVHRSSLSRVHTQWPLVHSFSAIRSLSQMPWTHKWPHSQGISPWYSQICHQQMPLTYCCR